MSSKKLIRNTSQAFLLLSNKYTPGVIELCNKIRQASAGLGDTFLAFHQTGSIAPEVRSNKHCFLFTDRILTDLHYIPISSTLVPGNNHFPLLDFYRKHPDYDYYWFIEDDVRFNGPWEQLFGYFTGLTDQPDFISSHLRTYNEEPHWYWWDTLHHFNQYIPLYLRIRSFNPIYRISNAALNCIHHILCADKWRGHHEVLLPTLLMLEGLQIADFGGTGQFVPPGLQNRFYLDDDTDILGKVSTGTMRYRPLVDTLEHADKLYHPVKE